MNVASENDPGAKWHQRAIKFHCDLVRVAWRDLLNAKAKKKVVII